MRREFHLKEKGNALGIGVYLDPELPFLNYNGCPIDAWAETDMIKVFGWREEYQICYFAGLHEIGHVASGHCTYNEDWAVKNVIESECEAWCWALDNCTEIPTWDTLDFITGSYALGSYMIHAGRIIEETEYGFPDYHYNNLYQKIGRMRHGEQINFVVQRSNGSLFTNFSQT